MHRPLQHIAAIAASETKNGPALAFDTCSRSARLLGYIEGRLHSLDSEREYTEQQEYDTMLPALHGTLGEACVAQLMHEGSGWTEEQAVAQAMLI